MASAASASSAAAPPFVRSMDSPHHPAIIYAARFDTAKLLEHCPPVGWNRVENKRLVWQMIEERQKKTAAAAAASVKDSSPPTPAPLLRFARYDSNRVPMDAALLLSASTSFETDRRVYDYSPSSSDPTECHFWVNFADEQLFGFYASSLFAQDEWQVQEHPSLASLRKFLEVSSQSNPDAAPLAVGPTQDGTRQPTPCIVMNAPREVDIDAVGANLYGNSFSRAPDRKSVV